MQNIIRVRTGHLFDHITPILRDLYWLKMPQRIDYKLAVLVFRCMTGTAPSYLLSELRHVADSESQSSALIFPATRHVTIGDRAFPATAAHVWKFLTTICHGKHCQSSKHHA
jgi:hypothetical protein